MPVLIHIVLKIQGPARATPQRMSPTADSMAVMQGETSVTEFDSGHSLCTQKLIYLLIALINSWNIASPLASALLVEH